MTGESRPQPRDSFEITEDQLKSVINILANADDARRSYEAAEQAEKSREEKNKLRLGQLRNQERYRAGIEILDFLCPRESGSWDAVIQRYRIERLHAQIKADSPAQEQR